LFSLDFGSIWRLGPHKGRVKVVESAFGDVVVNPVLGCDEG